MPFLNGILSGSNKSEKFWSIFIVLCLFAVATIIILGLKNCSKTTENDPNKKEQIITMDVIGTPQTPQKSMKSDIKKENNSELPRAKSEPVKKTEKITPEPKKTKPVKSVKHSEQRIRAEEKPVRNEKHEEIKTEKLDNNSQQMPSMPLTQEHETGIRQNKKAEIDKPEIEDFSALSQTNLPQYNPEDEPSSITESHHDFSDQNIRGLQSGLNLKNNESLSTIPQDDSEEAGLISSKSAPDPSSIQTDNVGLHSQSTLEIPKSPISRHEEGISARAAEITNTPAVAPAPPSFNHSDEELKNPTSDNAEDEEELKASPISLMPDESSEGQNLSQIPSLPKSDKISSKISIKKDDDKSSALKSTKYDEQMINIAELPVCTDSDLQMELQNKISRLLVLHNSTGREGIYEFLNIKTGMTLSVRFSAKKGGNNENRCNILRDALKFLEKKYSGNN
jgi:hypothetical protein